MKSSQSMVQDHSNILSRSMQQEMKVLNLRKNFSFLDNLEYFVGPDMNDSN